MVNFDDHAITYRKSLGHSLMLFGQKESFFDFYKMDLLSAIISKGVAYDLMDYGCGVGKLTILIAKEFPKAKVCGYDISAESMRVAEEESAGLKNVFFTTAPSNEQKYDFIIVANVFHHVEPIERKETLLKIKMLLKPGGKIIIFEHNPLNPVTRYIVSQCPFDKDAEIILRRKFLKLTADCGLKTDGKKYILFFPWSPKIFRKMEKLLGFMPLGAQYMLVLTL